MPTTYTSNEANPLYAQRLTRRPSVREVVITRNLNTNGSISSTANNELENGTRPKVI